MPTSSGWRPTPPGAGDRRVARARRRRRRHVLGGDIVVVACGAVNSAALLLRSASDRHPDGLANSSDVVGRHYMRHNNVALLARLAGAEPDAVSRRRWPSTTGTSAPTTGTTRWAESRCWARPTTSRFGPTPRGWSRRVTPDWPLEIVAHHSVNFWLARGPAPPREPRHPGRGREIHLALDEKTTSRAQRLRHKLDGMLGDSACTPSTAFLTHSSTCTRGCRSGQRPTRPERCASGRTRQTSALDVNCRAHELDNLYVVNAELLRLDRGRQSDPDHHRQRAPGGRPPARPARLRPRAQPGGRGRG